jgi:hypothetical protein
MILHGNNYFECFQKMAGVYAHLAAERKAQLEKKYGPNEERPDQAISEKLLFGT